MVLTQKLTPETLLSLPRRGNIVPNANGTIGLYHVSTHKFGVGTKQEWRVMDLETSNSKPITEDDMVHDVQWLPGSMDMVVWLRDIDQGKTQLVITDTDHPAQFSNIIATFDGKVQHLKLHMLEDGTLAFAMVGLASETGELFNEETAAPPSTARIYDDLSVREWTSYRKSQKYAIFYSLLCSRENGWKLAAPLSNLIKGTGLETPSSMYDPEDATSLFDLGPKGVLFVAVDPEPAILHYSDASDVYFVSLDSWTQRPACKPNAILVPAELSLGTASNPRFSTDGSMVAFLKSPFSNLADTRLLMTPLGSLAAYDVWDVIIGKHWDLVPGGFEFSPHGGSLYIIADDCGRQSLYELALEHGATPDTLMRNPSVSGFYALLDGASDPHLLVSSSSLVESMVYTVLDTSHKGAPRIVSTANRHGTKIDLSHSQVSEIWFEGSNNNCVQAWMVKPNNFSENKKYPLVLYIHGGPQEAARDAWSWRWNLATWAEQGYVVVAPNFTGSTGFGVNFTAAINGQWGGRPYEDLVCCMDHLSRLPFLDMDRAAAAGGSYGGYMIDWILGQPLAKKFKALICHSPILDTRMIAIHGDVPGGTTDFDGPAYPWANSVNLDKWNPARPDLLWRWRNAPPTLVIHGERDYRCSVVEGLGTFRALQFHGVKSRFLAFPDEGHFVENPENALVWHRTVFGWLEQHVGKGPAEMAEIMQAETTQVQGV